MTAIITAIALLCQVSPSMGGNSSYSMEEVAAHQQQCQRDYLRCYLASKSLEGCVLGAIK